MRPPKGDVWQGWIDHERWHVLVTSATRKVAILFPPHVPGTLKVYYRHGQQEVVALAEPPSGEIVLLLRQGLAELGANGQLYATQDPVALRALLVLELQGIDEATAAKIAEGVEHGSQTHSISVEALVKLDALANAEASAFPCDVSTLDNLDSIALLSVAAARELLAAARARLVELIAEGDRLKAAARSRAPGG